MSRHESSQTPAETISLSRKKRSWLLLLIGVLTVAAVVVLSWRPSVQASPQDVNVETSTVTKGDLAEEARQGGQLGYGPARELGSALRGTITSMAALGTVVALGDELYRVDDSPVLLLQGTLPVWRAFAREMDDGSDVLQLERNLATLGYFTKEADTDFNWDTETAIRAWQKALGITQTGSLELGRFIFSPGDVRVDAQKATTGDPNSATVLSVTGTAQVISVDIDPNLASYAAVGTSVDVALPNGTTTTAIVSVQGAPVERDGSDGEKKSKVPLTLLLDDPATGATFTNVTVNVTIRHILAHDVLTAPVLALLARPKGGFSVERVTPDGTELVDVGLGAFADGLVEIQSGDLAKGDEVVVGQ